MVHSFFNNISLHPELLNEAALGPKFQLKTSSSFSKISKFSEVFIIFFPKNGKHGKNKKSWLEVISSEFEFDEKKIKIMWRFKLELLFVKLGFSPRIPENIHVFHFFLYLIYMYRLLIKDGYWRQDHIFGFFNGFPIEETKVVMYTHRPAKTIWSSGYAFHGARSASTKNMLVFLQEEMRMLSLAAKDQSVEVNELEMKDLKTECDLSGWIKQGVLLLNMNFTPTNSVMYSDEIVIAHLNKEYANLVFLLLGAKVACKKPLINSRRHMLMNFFHPAFYSHNIPPPAEESPDCYYDLWERWLPFLNANFYLFQKLVGVSAPLIDWNCVGETKPGRDKRLQCLRSFFEEILEESKSELETEHSHRVSNDLAVFQINPGYLSLKYWNIHEELFGPWVHISKPALKFEKFENSKLHFCVNVNTF